MITRVLSVCALTMLLAGCRQTTEEPPPPAAPTSTTQAAAELRERLAKSHPDAIIGVVETALPEGGFVAVGKVDPKAVKDGEVFTFMAADGTVLAHGEVRSRTKEALNVEYRTVDRQRPPAVGDLAIRFKR